MTVDTSETSQVAQAPAENKNSEEKNLSLLRKKAERAEMLVEQERAERLKLQQELEQLKYRSSPASESENDWGDEPYIDQKTLRKVLQKERETIKKEAEENARRVMEEERRNNYMTRLKSEYPDFNEVFTDENLNRLEQVNPKMAQKILTMKDPYEQRELAYEIIKTAGLHKKKEDPKPSQQIAENNQRRLYYTPNTASSGNVPMGDFSQAGKKAAYEKIQQMARAPLNFR